MIQLKGYQQRVIDSLGDYLAECAQFLDNLPEVKANVYSSCLRGRISRL
jgi:hypothetical protein